MSSGVTTAPIRASPTTPAAIAIARSASGRRRSDGWKRARRNCCRFPISTSCSRCRRRSPQSPSRTRPRSMACCFRAAAETLTTIAGDPKHLGAEIGLTAVLHTWGQNLDHHPHVHCIVPGGGLSPDRAGWIRCRPGFFLSVRVLSRLFRRLFLEGLVAAFDAGELQFFGELAALEGARRVHRPSRSRSHARMGRLRQATLRRPRAGSGLSRALHAPRRHRQQPACRTDRATTSASAGRTIALMTEARAR